MTIHHTDPFATPEPDRSVVRRLRGRLVAPVTLWTAPGPAGLTVSSVLVADGDPGRLLGLVDEESDLWQAAVDAGVFAVCPLRADQRLLADRFAGLAPAPGGLFAQDRWTDTAYGPVPEQATTWAGCRVGGSRRFGWSTLVEATIVHVVVSDDETPLSYYRGRYRAVNR